MNGVLLVIGEGTHPIGYGLPADRRITAKQYEPSKLKLLRKGCRPRIVRTLSYMMTVRELPEFTGPKRLLEHVAVALRQRDIFCRELLGIVSSEHWGDYSNRCRLNYVLEDAFPNFQLFDIIRVGNDGEWYVDDNWTPHLNMYAMSR